MLATTAAAATAAAVATQATTTTSVFSFRIIGFPLVASEVAQPKPNGQFRV